MWDRILADVKLARCASTRGFPQIAFLLFIGVRVGGWWPWLAYKVKGRAARRALIERRKAFERVEALRKVQRQQQQGTWRKFRIVLAFLPLLYGCAVVSVRPHDVRISTLGKAGVIVAQGEKETRVEVKGAALSSIGAGVLSSALTAASLYFTGGLR